MSINFPMLKVSTRWYSLLLGASFILGIPSAALGQSVLTSAKVERIRNRVHLIPNGQGARQANVADILGVGDALRTASSARAELRFNDGSLARVGEQAIFRFTPNTRNFQLSNGTVLLLIPPGRGRSTIQTPNAVTGIQGSALFVRVRCMAGAAADEGCDSPVTIVGALTNNPAGAMVVYNTDGSQQQALYAGDIVVIEGDEITQRMQFDLKTFYGTSGLADGLNLDSPTPPADLSDDLVGVWREIQEALALQGDFDGQGPVEEIVQNPVFIAPVATQSLDVDGTLDNDGTLFATFPSFQSSPAAVFHGLGTQVADSSLSRDTFATSSPGDSNARNESLAIDPVVSSRVRSSMTSANGPSTPVVSATTSTVIATPSAPAGAVPSAATVTLPTVAAPAPAATLPTAAPPVATTPTATAPTVTAPTATTAPPVETTPTVTVPTATTAPPVETTPTVTPPVSSADQIPTREALPEEAFDLVGEPAGANLPDVLPTTGSIAVP